MPLARPHIDCAAAGQLVGARARAPRIRAIPPRVRAELSPLETRERPQAPSTQERGNKREATRERQQERGNKREATRERQQERGNKREATREGQQERQQERGNTREATSTRQHTNAHALTHMRTYTCTCTRTERRWSGLYGLKTGTWPKVSQGRCRASVLRNTTVGAPAASPMSRAAPASALDSKPRKWLPRTCGGAGKHHKGLRVEGRGLRVEG